MQPGHPASTTTSPCGPKATPPTPAPVALVQVSAVLTPAEVYQTAVNAAVAKQKAPLPKLVLMGVASGLCECRRGAAVP